MMMSMVMMMTLRMTVKLKSTKVNYLRWLHVPTVVPFYFLFLVVFQLSWDRVSTWYGRHESIKVVRSLEVKRLHVPDGI